MKIEILIMLAALLARHVYAQSNHGQETDRIYVTAVAWSHDGSKIAAVGIQPPGERGYLHILETQTGDTLYSLEPSPGGFSSVAWSPDDRFIAAGGYDQLVWIIDVQSHTTVASLQGHQSTVTEVNWNSDGTQLVSSGNWDGLTILWDMTTYEQSRVIESNDLFPTSTAFSPDGQRIAVGGEAGIRIYASNSSTDQNPSWYFKDLNVGAFAWNSDGSRIAFGTQTFQSVTNPNLKPAAQLYIIDSHNGTTLSNWGTEDQTITDIVWSPDEGLIATESLDSVVKVWDATSGKMIESFTPSLPGKTLYPREISFSPYGGQLAYGGTLPTNTPTVPSTPQVSIQSGIRSFANGAVQIAVPVPSLDRLSIIADLCGLPKTAAQSFPTQVTADSLNNFMATVQSLPAGTIPTACVADLVAVTQVLQAQ